MIRGLLSLSTPIESEMDISGIAHPVPEHSVSRSFSA